jgi:hypothetical protein
MVNNEWEKMWKEVAVTCCTRIFTNLIRKNKRNDEHVNKFRRCSVQDSAHIRNVTA